MLRSVALASLALLVPLTGCLAPGPTPGADVDRSDAPADHGVAALAGWSGLAIEGEGCGLGGGVAQNFIPSGVGLEFGVPAPFEAADTTEYLGLPVERSDLLVGNGHFALQCETWRVNGGPHAHAPNMGLVGLVVKPPPFEGVEPAERNFLLSTVATHDFAIVEALAQTGWYVYPATSAVFRSPYGAGALVDTAGDGTYYSEFVPTPTAPWSLIRFWLILPAPDGLLHPAYLDVRMEGGTTFYGQGLFSHTHTPDHGLVGRGDAPSGALLVEGFGMDADLTVLPGVVEGLWSH